MPGVVPPVGDMASAPREPELGAPTVVPGLLEMIAAEFGLLPPALLAGAVGAPASSGIPAPMPARPSPRPDAWPLFERLGGGGTTVAFGMLGTLRPVTGPELACTGGGTTSGIGRTGICPADRAMSLVIEGGGATALGAGMDSRAGEAESRCGDETGGGTTSVCSCENRACGSS